MRIRPVRDFLSVMSIGKILLIVVGFFALLAVVLGLWISGIFNRLVALQQGTDAAWAQV